MKQVLQLMGPEQNKTESITVGLLTLIFFPNCIESVHSFEDKIWGRKGKHVISILIFPVQFL